MAGQRCLSGQPVSGVHPGAGRSRRVGIFTICSNNYRPFAQIFLDSVRRHHPDAALFLCLADRASGAPDQPDDGYTVVEAHQLGIPEFENFAFRYDIMEFNTALKPFMFLYLLAEYGCEAVLYCDPDIEVFAPLGVVLSALDAGASFFLTPHLCSPSEDRREPNDLTILRAGTFNLGFLGVAATGETLGILRWWARQLRFHCVNAQPDGLFVDQKFIDLVPGFGRKVWISHDTTLNVAYWNLQQRRLDHDGEGWTVDGAPLTFFHFSGFDPRKADCLSKHDPRFASQLPPALRGLTEHYASRLLAAGFEQAIGTVYAYGHFASGARIPGIVRAMFRDTQPAWTSDPFRTYESFIGEIPLPAAQVAAGPGRSRLLEYLHGAMPQFGEHAGGAAGPEGADPLGRWFVRNAVEGLGIPLALVEAEAERYGQSTPLLATVAAPPHGAAAVDLTAPLQGADQAAEAGQLLFRSLLASGFSTEMFDVAGSPARAAPVQIMVAGIDSLATVLPAWVGTAPPGAYRIVVPLWNLAALAPAALALLEQVHEVWAPSRFLQLALAGRTDRPVVHMPLAVDAFPVRSVPESGASPGRFVFLVLLGSGAATVYDNVAATLRAFRIAFAQQRGGPQLVLAGDRGTLRSREMTALAGDIEADPDFLLTEHPGGRAAALALLRGCDVVVSLDRGRGLCPAIADAMLLGKPVVATGYAANRDYVTQATGFPIDYRLVAVPDGIAPGLAAPIWAEADVKQAAGVMRRLYGDRHEADPAVAAARSAIEDHFSVARVASLQERRLREIGLRR